MPGGSRERGAGRARPPAAAALPIPVLTDGRVRLRPWRHEDAARIVEACTDPRTRHFLAELPHPYGMGEAMGYVDHVHEAARQARQVGWCVADLATDRCVGAVAMMDLADGDGQTQVGYWAHPDARGRGVLTAALRLALRHALTPTEQGGMGLRRAWLRAAAGNPASQHVARAAGMTEVGRDRQAETLGDGTVDDLVRFDVLADELG